MSDVTVANALNSTPSIDELSPEQRRELKEQMEAFKTLTLQSFQRSCHGKVI